MGAAEAKPPQAVAADGRPMGPEMSLRHTTEAQKVKLIPEDELYKPKHSGKTKNPRSMPPVKRPVVDNSDEVRPVMTFSTESIYPEPLPTVSKELADKLVQKAKPVAPREIYKAEKRLVGDVYVEVDQYLHYPRPRMPNDRTIPEEARPAPTKLRGKQVDQDFVQFHERLEMKLAFQRRNAKPTNTSGFKARVSPPLNTHTAVIDNAFAATGDADDGPANDIASEEPFHPDEVVNLQRIINEY